MEVIPIAPMTILVWGFFIMNNNMWNVQYKRHNVTQLWSTLGNYDNKESALIHATRALEYYFMLKVTDPEGNVIWSN